MRRSVWLGLLILTCVTASTVSQAQDNSFISPTNAFWHDSAAWSLAIPPSITQSAIYVTNAPAKNITIDSVTAVSFAGTLTISNLTFSSAAANVLYLDNTGTTALHVLNGLHVGGLHSGESGTLVATNSTLIVDGSLGDKLENDGTMVIIGGSLITTNCSLQIAGTFYPIPGLLILSNALVRARDITITSGGPSSGSMQVIGGTMTLSSSLTVGNGDLSPLTSLLVANGARLVVTNGETAVGGFYESSGSMTVSNATFLAADVFLGD